MEPYAFDAEGTIVRRGDTVHSATHGRLIVANILSERGVDSFECIGVARGGGSVTVPTHECIRVSPLA